MKRWLIRLTAAALIAVAIAIAAAGIGFAYLEARLPDVFSFASYRRIALQSSRVHAAGGELLARFGAENRTVVPLQHIPKTMLYAAVCAEDAAFFHHPGLDITGIARAIWVDLTQGRFAQGASTITQQFAKTRFLSREKTIIRKLKELVLARKLEQKLQKNDILAMYLNDIYFGHGRYGVEEASRYYFNKPVARVDLAEAAMLAGLINGPGRLSPFRRPEACQQRRAYVLDQMHRRGYISKADAERANAVQLPTKPGDKLELEAPYYVSETRRRLRDLLPASALRLGGLRIEVGLDAVAQASAQEAITSGLARIDRKFRFAKPLRHYKTDAQIQSAIKKLRAKREGSGLRPGRIALAVVLENQVQNHRYLLDAGGEPAVLFHKDTSRYADADLSRALYKRGDLIRIAQHSLVTLQDGQQAARVTLEQGPQAALVAIEPQTRLVRALVGGDDFARHRFNRAVAARRQPGSTFKTFVMGAALEAGLLTPDTTMTDERRSYPSGGRRWTPRNYSGRWDGKSHTIRSALARSINSIAVAVAERVGPANVVAFAKRVGIDSELRADLPLALGASSVVPMELANAYATIAAGGVLDQPIMVTRVLDRDGRELYRAMPSPKRVINAKTAAQLADMLGDVVRYGSARGAKVGRPIAGKTGTTNRGRDNWFAGFSAGLATVAWVGHDDREPIPKGTGARLALPIWTRFMRGALQGVAAQPLQRLPHIRATPPDEGADDDEVADIEDTVLESYAEQL